MANPKHYLFPELFQEVAQFGFVLSHPARLHIIKALLLKGVLETAEIIDLLPLSAATVSKHLRYLERAGLLRFASTPFGTTGYELIVDRYKLYQEALEEFYGLRESAIAA